MQKSSGGPDEMDTSGEVEILHPLGSVASVWKWSDLTEQSRAEVARFLGGKPFASIQSDDLLRILHEVRRSNQKRLTGAWSWTD